MFGFLPFRPSVSEDEEESDPAGLGKFMGDSFRNVWRVSYAPLLGRDRFAPRLFLRVPVFHSSYGPFVL